MALDVDYDEVRARLLAAQPKNWLSDLSIALHKPDMWGFKNAKEFITGDTNKKGLGLSLDKAVNLMYLQDRDKDKADEIIKEYGLIPVLGEVGVSKGDKTENITFDRGTSKDYRIAKLKRDFGEKEVMEAIEDNGYTKASQVERHFGVGKQLLTPLEKVIRAYERLDDREKDIFMELTQKNAVVN